MEMSEIYNGSQWAHDLFLVNKAGATEYITDRSYPLFHDTVIRFTVVHGLFYIYSLYYSLSNEPSHKILDETFKYGNI